MASPSTSPAAASFTFATSTPKHAAAARWRSGLGFGDQHLDMLVEGTLPQRRVLNLAPGMAGVGEADAEREQLRGLFEDAMEY